MQSTTNQIVALLIHERDKLTRAIEALQPKRRGRPPADPFAHVLVKRRGRPPGSKNKIHAVATPPVPAISKRGSIWTPARRAAQAKRVRAMWKKGKFANRNNKSKAATA